MTTAVELRDVVVTRGETTILDRVNLHLELAGRLAIVGPSGSGKTHILRVINRLTERTSGSVAVLGNPIEEWAPTLLRREVGFVAQRPALGNGTALEAVATATRLGFVTKDQLAARLETALDVAGIHSTLGKREIRKLSAGERSRVALARALVCEPRVLLLDEPTASLDGDSARGLVERLVSWSRTQSCALAVVTHRLEDVEILDGAVAILEAGALVEGDASASKIIDDTSRYDIVRLLTGRRES